MTNSSPHSPNNEEQFAQNQRELDDLYALLGATIKTRMSHYDAQARDEIAIIIAKRGFNMETSIMLAEAIVTELK